MSIRFATSISLLLLIACDRNASGPAEVVVPVETSNTGKAFFLDGAELSAHMRRARSGDNEAAVRIAEHYAMAELKPEEELPWLLMAAERGHIGAMTSLGYRYGSGMYKDTDCAKAKQWLVRAESRASPAEIKKYSVREQKRALIGSGSKCHSKSPNYSFKPTPLRGAA